MACELPLMAFDTGLKSETGKAVFHYERPGTEYVFLNSLKRKFAFSPIKVKTLNGQPVLADPIPIPCGSCAACRMQFSAELSTRAVLEAQYWDHAFFVTLTYSNRCLPISKFTGEAVLIKEELVRFIKRLRRRIDCRVLACGEYGDDTGRPHFHLIVYSNEDLRDRQEAINVYHSKVIEDCWKFGLSEVSNADAGCMSYVAGYVLKKCQLEADDDKFKPFRIMPRRPGLGMWYLVDHDVISDGKVYGDFGKDCKSKPVPGAFIRKLEEDPRILSVKESNKLNGLRFNKAMHAWYGTSDVELLGGLRRNVIENRVKTVRKDKGL